MPFADANEDTCQQTPCIECCAVSPQRGFRLGSVCHVAVNRVRQFRPRGAFEVVEIQDILKVLRHMVGPLSFAARLPRVRADGIDCAHPRSPDGTIRASLLPGSCRLRRCTGLSAFAISAARAVVATGRETAVRTTSPAHLSQAVLQQHSRDVASPTSASFDGVPG